MTYYLNISDCFLNALIHYSFPVDYHSTCTPPWIVDVVGDMVSDPFCSAPYVDSLFEDDVERNKCSKDAGHSCPWGPDHHVFGHSTVCSTFLYSFEVV